MNQTMQEWTEAAGLAEDERDTLRMWKVTVTISVPKDWNIDAVAAIFDPLLMGKLDKAIDGIELSDIQAGEEHAK